MINLYKFVMGNILNNVRMKVNKYWNDKYLELKIFEIVDIIDVFS